VRLATIGAAYASQRSFDVPHFAILCKGRDLPSARRFGEQPVDEGLVAPKEKSREGAADGVVFAVAEEDLERRVRVSDRTSLCICVKQR
jgi:hypothetical protein